MKYNLFVAIAPIIQVRYNTLIEIVPVTCMGFKSRGGDC